MSSIQLTFAAAFVLAGISCAWGYQYQALFFLMLVIWGGFTNENFLVLVGLYFIVLAGNAILRMGRGR